MRNPMMRGERVYLRPVEPSDAEQFARHAAIETDTMMDRLRLPFSPIAFEHWIVELYKQQPPDKVVFAVCLRDGDDSIGNVGLWDIDWVNRTAETASWIGDPERRGKGYGTEAKHLLLEYAFERLHLHVLMSWVWEVNTRSAAALRKQGYRPAGSLRWEELKEGVYRDGLMFDVLREEWLAAREQWQASRTSPG